MTDWDVTPEINSSAGFYLHVYSGLVMNHQRDLSQNLNQSINPQPVLSSPVLRGGEQQIHVFRLVNVFPPGVFMLGLLTFRISPTLFFAHGV